MIERTHQRNQKHYQNALLSARNNTYDYSSDVAELKHGMSHDSYLRILSLPIAHERKLMRRAWQALAENQTPPVHTKHLLLNCFKLLKSNVKEQRLVSVERQLQAMSKPRTQRYWLRRWLQVTKGLWRARAFDRRRVLRAGLNVIKENWAYERRLEWAEGQIRRYRMHRLFAALAYERQLALEKSVRQEQHLYLKKVVMMKRIFKVWFNMVSLTKKYKKLDQITSKPNEGILRDNFNQWLFNSQLHDLRSRAKRQMLKKFFSQWLRLALKKKQLKKCETINKALAINRKAFNSLKLYYVT